MASFSPVATAPYSSVADSSSMRAEIKASAAVPAAPPARLRANSRRPPSPARATGHLLIGLLLAAFVVFFILPVLWLLLAATKTDPQLVSSSPLAFGSWHALRHNWDALTSFQGDTILLWLRNSILQATTALVITLAVGIPAGYALAMTEFRGRRAQWVGSRPHRPLRRPALPVAGE